MYDAAVDTDADHDNDNELRYFLRLRRRHNKHICIVLGVSFVVDVFLPYVSFKAQVTVEGFFLSYYFSGNRWIIITYRSTLHFIV